MKTKNVRINVTQKDIETGKRTDPWACPIARAIGRKITVSNTGSKFSLGYSVKTTEVRINREFISLPDKAQSFIEKFDAQNAVDPFSFSLAIPTKFLK